MSNKLTALSVATAVAAALSVAAVAGTSYAQYKGPNTFKCYGISKAGQNDCANAAGTHSCAGHSTVRYDLGEWKALPDKAACDAAGGSDKPGKGVNHNAKKS